MQVENSQEINSIVTFKGYGSAIEHLTVADENIEIAHTSKGEIISEIVKRTENTILNQLSNLTIDYNSRYKFSINISIQPVTE